MLAEAGHMAGVSSAELFQCGPLGLQCCHLCGNLRLAEASFQAKEETTKQASRGRDPTPRPAGEAFKS